MRQFSDYSTVIFDCDGVIFDSNNLKVEAMRESLAGLGFPEQEVATCTQHFKDNFGISRYVHVDYFITHYLTVEEANVDDIKQGILEAFSDQCMVFYQSAAIADHMIDLLESCRAKKYIASGSDQTELRQVIASRGLSHYFVEVNGSPKKKADIIADILTEHGDRNAVMIGDAKSDLLSAEANDIDFIYYRPLSDVDSVMREMCAINNHRVVDSLEELSDEC